VTGKRHEYQVVATWTGNLGEGTARYAAYSRDHDVSGEAKPTIPGTADPAFRGDPTRWNPEELLVASLSQCHMLEFLAQAARAGVVVTRYVDEPSGTMVEAGDGGSFVEVILRPRVTVAHDDMVDAWRQIPRRSPPSLLHRELCGLSGTSRAGHRSRRPPGECGKVHRRRHPTSCLRSLRASCPRNPTPLRSTSAQRNRSPPAPRRSCCSRYRCRDQALSAEGFAVGPPSFPALAPRSGERPRAFGFGNTHTSSAIASPN
jgi:organic hydroperoxide reductase OsmC/OhrA